MQFTLSEAQNLTDVAAASGVTDPRIVAALAPLLYAVGLGKYPVDFTVNIDISDGHASIDVTRGSGEPYPVDVLTGGRISAETAAAQNITPADIVSGAIVVNDQPFTDNRPTRTIVPDPAGPVESRDGIPGVQQ